MTHYDHLVREHRLRVARSLLAYERSKLVEPKKVAHKEYSLLRALVPAWK